MEVSTLPKAQIAGIQTVMPAKVTHDRKPRPICVGDPAGADIFRRTLNIVLYYRHVAGDTDSGWLVAGWIKESLGTALAEEPMLSGRLRRRKSEVDGEDRLEVVANDSGVRLVEAKIPARLPEFLELVKGDRAKGEAEILFWRDIDEADPQFSPLFYVQVTNFECGGYSIGISSSILLADLLLGTDFLTKWSEIQTHLLLHKPTDHHRRDNDPIFYLPALKQDIRFLSFLSSSPFVQNHHEPTIFHAESDRLDEETFEKLASICTKKAEMGTGRHHDVFMFLKEKGESGEAKTEVRLGCGEAGKNSVSDCGGDCEMRVLRLEELGLSDLSFWRGKRAEYSSCKVGCVSNGLVLVVPSASPQLSSFTKVIVATPP